MNSIGIRPRRHLSLQRTTNSRQWRAPLPRGRQAGTVRTGQSPSLQRAMDTRQWRAPLRRGRQAGTVRTGQSPSLQRTMVACPPEPGPGGMRVSTARSGGRLSGNENDTRRSRSTGSFGKRMRCWRPGRRSARSRRRFRSPNRRSIAGGTGTDTRRWARWKEGGRSQTAEGSPLIRPAESPSEPHAATPMSPPP